MGNTSVQTQAVSFDGTVKGEGSGQNIDYSVLTPYSKAILEEIKEDALQESLDFLDLDNYLGPVVEVDAATLSNDEWQARRVGDKKTGRLGCLGGSSISAVFGVNQYKSNLTLQHEILGDVPLSSDDEEDAEGQLIKDFGHIVEGWIADWIQVRYPMNRVIIDTNIYQHARYPYLTANVDRMMQRPDGSWVLVEIKTASYRMKEKWDNDNIPLPYLYQVRLYMSILNISECIVVCMFSRDDIIIRSVKRNLDEEAYMLEGLKTFWDENILAKKKLTPLGPAEEIIKTIAKYGGKATKGKSIQLPAASFKKKCEDYLMLQDVYTQAKKYAEACELKLKEAQIPFIEQMGDATSAEITQKGDYWLVEYSPVEARKTVNSKLLKTKYPDVYTDCLKVSGKESRRFSLKKARGA